jgi:hypothetical protein
LDEDAATTVERSAGSHDVLRLDLWSLPRPIMEVALPDIKFVPEPESSLPRENEGPTDVPKKSAMPRPVSEREERHWNLGV